MLRPPAKVGPAALAEHLPRDHPIPMSIPVRAALKKERVMDEAAFALLVRLAENAQTRLRAIQNDAADLTTRAEAGLQANELYVLLDKAREEQKGGA